MASDNEASCENDPNFAVICAFLEKFGGQCGLPSVDFLELQGMLENCEEVPLHLTEIFIKLLRRIKKTVKNDKWERALVSVCHMFSTQDAWEVERFGYKKAKLSSKIRVLKELLEMQFDYHIKFKNEINKLTAEQLRSQPLGRDKTGHAYWFHSDDNYQIRVYKEDLDEETWTLIAKDRESLVLLINKLSDGEAKSSSDCAANEDSSSLSEKPVIDTGQNESESKNKNSELEANSAEPKKVNENKEATAEFKSDGEPDSKHQEILETKEDNPREESKKDGILSTNSSEEKQHDKPIDSSNNALVDKSTTSIADEKPRPLLRIKNLSELMGTNAKRSRFDEEDEPQSKVLKLKIKNLNKDPIVEEEIEEPVMKVVGEGSGEENEGMPIQYAEQDFFKEKNVVKDPVVDEPNDISNDNAYTAEESPIVGDVIEEDVIYFYGEGFGVECQTGNEEKSSTGETKSTSEVTHNSSAEDRCVSSSSSTDSIKDNLSDFKDNNDKAKEVPSIKLGTIIDTKTDNNITKLSVIPSKKSRWDVAKLEDKTIDEKTSESLPVLTGKVKDLVNRFEQVSSPSQENNSETKIPLTSPKKSLFFFGSASLKSNSVSPSLTMGFGENSPKQETDSNISNNEDLDGNFKEIETEPSEKEVPCDTSRNLEYEKQNNNNHSSNNEETVKEKNNTKNSHVESVDEKTGDVNNSKNATNNAEENSDNKIKDITENKSAPIESLSKETDLKKKTLSNPDIKECEAKRSMSRDIKIIVENSLEIKESIAENLKKHKQKSSEIEKRQIQQAATKKDKKSAENGGVEKDNGNQSKKLVIEPLCIRKTAYLCGNEGSEDSKEGRDISDFKRKKKLDSSTKHLAKEEEPQSQMDDIKLVKERESESREVLNKEGSKKNEESDVVEANKRITRSKTECEKTTLVIKETKVNATKETLKTTEFNNPKKENNQPNKPDGKKKEVTSSLRSVRSKKIVNPKNVDSEYQKVFLSTVQQSRAVENSKENASSEVNNVKPRRGRSRKQREETPPNNSAQEETKKPKLVEKEIDQSEEIVSTRSNRRSTRGKNATDIPNKEDSKTTHEKGRNGSNMPSAESSRVTTPVSTADSIIIVPDSTENSVDVVEKDPLANSEEETVPSQKPINLQSFSLDYNESATPPPIPVIPPRRPLRKRGRDTSPEVKEVEAIVGKRMKMKGKRQIDTKLRKSIEKKKEQQVSSSDEVLEASDEEKATAKSPKKKMGMQMKNKKGEPVIEISDEESVPRVPKPKKTYNKNSRLLANLGITDNKPIESIGDRHVRQSRRIAQIKIKEQAEGKKPDVQPPKEEKLKKKKVKEDKDYKGEKKKKIKDTDIKRAESPEPEPEPEDTKKKKRRKFKAPSKIFDEHRPWKSSSESSEGEEEVEEEEEEVIEEEEPVLEFRSDHEFSPESDLETGEEALPLKRARTARKKYGEESDEEEEVDNCPCQKCGKSDHPEWVLLCDKCDNGWHCSCLRPPFLVIPEGDWFCPPCEHLILVGNLQQKLIEYDKKLSKKEIEDRRKERLAYVGISLNNVLPSRENEHRKKKRRHSAEGTASSSGSESSSEYESESDSDEPIYQLRQRRQARSYKFSEYDDLIKSAIQDEMDEKGLEIAAQSRGKDIATIVRAEQEERKEKEEQAKNNESQLEVEGKPPVSEEKKEETENTVKPPMKKGRKKRRKINNLDISSEEDDEKDEDFKGTSSGSEEEEFDDGGDSDGESDDDMWGGKRRKSMRPVRRSTRTRISRYDADFVDDSDYEDIPRKKKKRQYWSESESEESDRSWGRKKRKGRPSAIVRKQKSKKKKKSIFDELSDIEPLKKKKPKIKYGGLTSSDEEIGRGRRTRGKKTTYVDTLGSDSEEENQRKKNPRRIESDDEDFVANEEEKDSEEEQDDLVEEGQEDESSSDRRPLVVPKIYIKKPPVSKEIEKPKERHVPLVEKDTNSETSKETEQNQKPIEPGPKLVEEEPKSVETSQLAQESSLSVQESSLSVQESSLSVQEKSQIVQEISRPLQEIRQPIQEAPQKIQEAPQKNQEAPQSIQEIPQPVQEKSQLAEKELKPVEKTPILVEEKPVPAMEKPKPVEEIKCNENKQEQIKTSVNLSQKDDTEEEEDELDEEEDIDDDEDGNPIAEINKNLEDMDSDEMEKMMEEEEYANKQLQLVALQIEKEKKRKAKEEARRLENAGRVMEAAIPVKRGRKPKVKEPIQIARNIIHEPIVSNVRALIHNDDSNDELSEPPGVALPLFAELTLRRNEDDAPKKRRGRGKAKKSLEETVASLGGRRKEKPTVKTSPEVTAQSGSCNIEIAAPPQPFSQASPTPSVITRMLQTKPGQTTSYPIGTIRPKQFATMPDDDDDLPSSRSRGSSPSTGNLGQLGGPPSGQFISGSSRGTVGSPFRSMYSSMNRYPRGVLPAHQMRGSTTSGMPPHIYHSHRPHDPSPSGGGPINMSDSNTSPVVPPPASSPGSKVEPQNYSRPPLPPPASRFPPISTSAGITMTPPRPIHMLGHMQQSRSSSLNSYPPANTPPSYYGVYPADSMTNEDAMPPTAFQNSPYPEQFAGEIGTEPSENSNSKSYGEEESGGEFGGLVSYFSSQREDNLES